MTFNIDLARKIATGVAVAALGLVAFDLAPAAAAPPSRAGANSYRSRSNDHDWNSRDRHDDHDWNDRDRRDGRDWGRHDDHDWDRRDNRWDSHRYGDRYDNGRYGSYSSRYRRGTPWDIDGDGRRNSRDYDRDGDGVPNSRDHHPDDPRRR